jgi:nitrite reductase/ring-hydroxylating ferredoxin subunit
MSMKRRDFIRKGCAACLGMAAGLSFLESCAPVKHINGDLVSDGLEIPLSIFTTGKNASAYVVVRNEALQYPVCVYRLPEGSYSALYMQCTHQGAELQVAGDRLTCPAHGSEFDVQGIVKQGPANTALRRFPVKVDGDHLFIDLRKQS